MMTHRTNISEPTDAIERSCANWASVLQPTIAQIDLDLIQHNIRQIRQLVGPDIAIMPTVKANAYGYGAFPIARTIESEIDMLGVAFVHEGVELRQRGIKCPILVLSSAIDSHIKPALDSDLTLAVSSEERALAISQIAHSKNIIAQIHIEVDTGMGRLGIPYTAARKTVERIYSMPNLQIKGIYSHFATSEISNDEYTTVQTKRFNQLLSDLSTQGIRIPVKHMANSGAILQYPETWFDLVRPGLMIYGIYPAEHLKKTINLLFPLSIKTRIIQIREFEKGDSISYGRSYICQGRRRIAVLQVGYADGFSRALSNRTKVMIGDKAAPVIGNICMDTCMIDVTDLNNISVGDEVLLLGGDKGLSMIERLCVLLGTIPYELIATLGQRVRRIYTGRFAKANLLDYDDGNTSWRNMRY